MDNVSILESNERVSNRFAAKIIGHPVQIG